MKAACLWLMLCGVAVADSAYEARVKQEKKMARNMTSLGTIPVKYHEMFGPYKLWVIEDRDGFSNFEARFVTIKNGAYVFGLDDRSTTVTNTKQTRLYSIPMKRFSLRQQEEFRKEYQKRQKDLKEKRVTYPEPTPEVVAINPSPATAEKRKEKRYKGTFVRDPKTGKLKPVDIEMTDAEIEAEKNQKPASHEPPAKKTTAKP